MLDLEKVAQEFAFLREKLREIASFLAKNEPAEAAFMTGCLHSICHNHAVSISQMVPQKSVVSEVESKSVCD